MRIRRVFVLSRSSARHQMWKEFVLSRNSARMCFVKEIPRCKSIGIRHGYALDAVGRVLDRDAPPP